MAAAAGTNATYVSDARKIGAADPELLREVAAGETTIPEALEKIGEAKPKKSKSKTKANTSGDALVEDAEVEEEIEEAKPREYRDDLGHPIPERLQKFWDDDDLYDKISSHAGEILKLSKLIAGKDCGARYNQSIVDAEAKNIKKESASMRPHCLCPKCHGGGCKECGKLGWVTKQQFALFPAGVRNGWEHAGKTADGKAK